MRRYSSRRQTGLAQRLLVAALWLLILTAPAFSRAADSGFLHIFSGQAALQAELRLPVPALRTRFGTRLEGDLDQIAEVLEQDLSLVADGRVCRLSMRVLTQAPVQQAFLSFAIKTDCPAAPQRLDAHVALFGPALPNYRTLVSFERADSVQHALSTRDEACVAFEAKNDRLARMIEWLLPMRQAQGSRLASNARAGLHSR